MLERLDGRVPGVGHVGVDGAGAGAAGGGAHASGDRLVVGERAAAELVPSAQGQVVHGAGTGGGNAVRRGLSQRAEKDVGDALRGFDVAGGHGGGQACVDHRALGCDHADGAHQARGVGNVFGDQAAEDVHGGGDRDGVVGVDGAGNLGIRAGEIDGGGAAFQSYGNGNLHRARRDAVVIEIILNSIAARRQAADGGAHHALAVILEGAHIAAHASEAVSPTRSSKRSWPRRIAMNCASRSPSRSTGVRTLARIRSSSPAIDLPCPDENSTGGIRNPS